MLLVAALSAAFAVLYSDQYILTKKSAPLSKSHSGGASFMVQIDPPIKITVGGSRSCRPDQFIFVSSIPYPNTE
jgi:hypothetical protein